MNRKELLEALEIVKPAVSSREIIEQSTSFAFVDGAVVAYNDEISIRHPVKALGLKLDGAIRAEELYQLLSKLKCEEVTVEISEKEVLVHGGRATAGLPLQQEIKLPIDEITQEDKLKWKKLPKDFCKALEFVSFTCSRDNSKPVLTCVHVASNYLESSDDFRMTRHKTKLSDVSCLIPCSSIQTVAKYELTEIATDESWVHFRNEKGTCLSCRLFEGKFPTDTVTKALKVDGHQFTLPERVIPVLERAGIFTKMGYAKGSAVDELVTITVSKKGMVIEAKGEAGWFKEELNVEYKGDSFSFGVNPLFLKQITEQLKNCVIAENRLKFEGPDWEHVIALKV